VRHVRSAALHAIFPSHSRRDAIYVAPRSARAALTSDESFGIADYNGRDRGVTRVRSACNSQIT
jgi:hypothetical protein